MADIHEGWLTKQQASESLGVSTKSVEAYIAKGLIQSVLKPRVGKPPILVLHPGDVDKLREERQQQQQPQTFLVPAGPAIQPDDPQQFWRGLVDVLANVAQRPVAALPAPSDILDPSKLFLSVREASKVSGLPADYLRGLVKSGELPARKVGNRAFIKRADLEKL